jgi:hypothetical protein
MKMEVSFRKQIPKNVATFSKQWEAGDFDILCKEDWEKIIVKRAEAARTERQSSAQAYAKFITESPEGRALLRAFQRAPIMPWRALSFARAGSLSAPPR